MTVHYLPDIGFKFESKEINWGEKRDLIRQVLSMKFQQDDGIIDNSEFFDGDTTFDIVYRRDIYENFTAIYDKDDRLIELEIHREIEIHVIGVPLVFGKEIFIFVNEFKTLGYQPTEIRPGEFFFESLKMTISTSGSMGGEGNGLDYFYAAKDVSHVIDEIRELQGGAS